MNQKNTTKFGFSYKSHNCGLTRFFYTTLGVDGFITIRKVNPYIPTFIPDPETQPLINESIKSSFALTFDSWTIEKETVDTGHEYQLGISSSSKSKKPKYLVTAHQRGARS